MSPRTNLHANDPLLSTHFSNAASVQQILSQIAINFPVSGHFLTSSRPLDCFSLSLAGIYTQWPWVSSQISLQQIDKKNWSDTIVFSNQLRQHPQMVIALGKNTGYIFYIITKICDVISCCYGHKHWLQFFRKISRW